jgi:hypothetical protein
MRIYKRYIATNPRLPVHTILSKVVPGTYVNTNRADRTRILIPVLYLNEGPGVALLEDLVGGNLHAGGNEGGCGQAAV